MCCMERRGTAGREVVEERREGGRSVEREKRVGVGGAREGLNASHVKLMRTNL